MKAIQVNGKRISGKNYGELKGQIMAMNLDEAARNKALSKAGQAFPKKTRGKENGRRTYVHQDKGATGELKTERLKDGNISFKVLTGPAKKVAAALRDVPNARNIFFLSTQAFAENPQAVAIILEGNVDRAKAGDISKEALAPYLKMAGYSRISSIKMVKVHGTPGFLAVGENMQRPNVQAFIQAVGANIYTGKTLRGAKMGEENVSTNIFLATDTTVRQGAWWPAAKDEAKRYYAFTIGASSLSYLGQDALFGITPDGTMEVATLEKIIEASALAMVRGQLAQLPWQKVGMLDLKKMGDGPYEASVAQATELKEGGVRNGYTVFITGHGQLATVKLTADAAKASFSSKESYQEFVSDMALLGFVNDGETAVLTNRNGGPNLVSFRNVDEVFKDAKNIPAGIVAARKVRTERIAAKAELRQ